MTFPGNGFHPYLISLALDERLNPASTLNARQRFQRDNGRVTTTLRSPHRAFGSSPDTHLANVSVVHVREGAL